MKIQSTEIWNTAKAVAKGKVYSYLCLHLKKKRERETSQTIQWCTIKLIEIQEKPEFKVSRWREIIKIRAKINVIETKRTI
jgi:hypothetical protein